MAAPRRTPPTICSACPPYINELISDARYGPPDNHIPGFLAEISSRNMEACRISAFFVRFTQKSPRAQMPGIAAGPGQRIPRTVRTTSAQFTSDLMLHIYGLPHHCCRTSQ
eukprot:scaffold3487_cov251-Pinguiococcus_pyrenoidosus.AAC.4